MQFEQQLLFSWNEPKRANRSKLHEPGERIDVDELQQIQHKKNNNGRDAFVLFVRQRNVLPLRQQRLQPERGADGGKEQHPEIH